MTGMGADAANAGARCVAGPNLRMMTAALANAAGISAKLMMVSGRMLKVSGSRRRPGRHRAGAMKGSGNRSNAPRSPRRPNWGRLLSWSPSARSACSGRTPSRRRARARCTASSGPVTDGRPPCGTKGSSTGWCCRGGAPGGWCRTIENANSAIPAKVATRRTSGCSKQEPPGPCAGPHSGSIPTGTAEQCGKCRKPGWQRHRQARYEV